MSRKVWRLSLSWLSLLLLLGGVFAPTAVQAAASTEMFNERYSVDLFVYIPCANGGAGEYLQLTGYLHGLYTYTSTGGGGYVYKYSYNPQGISGYGQPSGDKYQATGLTTGQGTTRVGYEETFVNNFKISGQNTGNNFLVHENFHVTVNANGTLSTYVDNFSITCK